MSQKALIIGNGASRAKFDLNKAAEDMTTFGCNALYRDFTPDYLVAIDGYMIQEIRNSGFPEDKLIIPDIEDQYEPEEYNRNRPRENAGMLAMKIAIQKGFDELYCVGMDFMINNYDVNLNNIYKNTQNYEPHRLTSYDDTVRRTKYFQWFTRKHENIKFFMLFPPGALGFHNLIFGDNVKGYTFSNEFILV